MQGAHAVFKLGMPSFKKENLLPLYANRIWPILRLSVQYVLLFRAAYDLTSWPSG